MTSIWSETNSSPSLTAGSHFFSSGSTNFISISRDTSAIWLPISEYLISLMDSIEFLALEIEPSTSVSAFTASIPMSSHMVPKRSTPAWFCATWSSMLKSACRVSSVAAFALSPPAANFSRMVSASSPSNSKPSVVLAAVSFTRIPNSL